MIWKRIVVREMERALVFVYGELVEVLMPGVHRVSVLRRGIDVEIVSALDTVLRSERTELLVRSGSALVDAHFLVPNAGHPLDVPRAPGTRLSPEDAPGAGPSFIAQGQYARDVAVADAVVLAHHWEAAGDAEAHRGQANALDLEVAHQHAAGAERLADAVLVIGAVDVHVALVGVDVAPAVHAWLQPAKP